MRIEHIALNVEAPAAMARWYCEHLAMRVVRKGTGAAQAHFLADGAGCVVLEIYNNPKDQVPHYRDMDPLILHVAFAADDVEGIYRRLLAAGATDLGGVTRAGSGDTLAMVRDPWGLAVQIVRRAKPLLGCNGP